MIYLGAVDGDLFALNSDGQELWAYFGAGSEGSSPAIGPNGTLYVGGNTPAGMVFYAFGLTEAALISPPTFTPAAPTNMDRITVQVKVTSSLGVASVVFNYQALGSGGQWLQAAMSLSAGNITDGIWSVTIGPFPAGTLSYYVLAMNEQQQPTGTPTGQLTIGTASTPNNGSIITIAQVTTAVAATVQVPVTLTAQGDENTLGGTVAFDPTILGNPQVALGTDDPTADWMVNTSQAASGLVAFAIALPPGQTFPAGVQQVAVLTFDLLDTSFIGPTPLTFTQQPMPCELVDSNANDLNATWQNGSVTIDHAPVAANASYTINENTTLTTTAATGVLANASDKDGNTLTAVLITSPSYGTLTFYADGSFTYVPKLCFVTTDTFTYQAYDGMAYSNTATVTITVNATGYEGDVAPKPYGNGVVTLADWVQEGRYVVGLDPIPSYPNSIFMAADCAPLATKGDGQLTVADWVQVGRFALGLDPLTPIGGPAQDPPAGTRARSASRLLAGKTTRALSVDAATLTRGKAGTVAVTLKALGDESALGFSVRFDPKCLKFVSAKVTGVAADATLNVNAKDAASGTLGVALMLPLPKTCTFGKGTVVEFTFLPLAAGATPLSFSDQVVTCEIAGASAAALPATFVNGTVLVRQ